MHQGVAFGYDVGDGPTLQHLKRDCDVWVCLVPGCDFKRVDKSIVRRHVNGHIGHRPFKCLRCSYTSTQKASLLSHFFNKHHGSN